MRWNAPEDFQSYPLVRVSARNCLMWNARLPGTAGGDLRGNLGSRTAGTAGGHLRGNLGSRTRSPFATTPCSISWRRAPTIRELLRASLAPDACPQDPYAGAATAMFPTRTQREVWSGETRCSAGTATTHRSSAYRQRGAKAQAVEPSIYGAGDACTRYCGLTNLNGVQK